MSRVGDLSRGFLKACGRIARAPFAALAAGIMWAVGFNSVQIRALMCWAMLGGIAVLTFVNVGHTYAANVVIERLRARDADLDQTPFLDLLIEQIRANSILQGLMVVGVVIIAVQANSFKARLGEWLEVETDLKDAAKSAMHNAAEKSHGPIA